MAKFQLIRHRHITETIYVDGESEDDVQVRADNGGFVEQFLNPDDRWCNNWTEVNSDWVKIVKSPLDKA